MNEWDWQPDQAAIEGFHQKCQVIRDWITAIHERMQTGLYVYGAGGIGKSHTVLEQLDHLKANYKVFNSRMTAKGLFECLKKDQDCIHVLEDLERIQSDKDSQSLLRAALWAPGGRGRKVTWTTAKGPDEFTFSGGIVMLANRPLASLPELEALATRIAVYRLEATHEEMLAKLYELTAAGYRLGDRTVLQSDSCREVAAYLLREAKKDGCPLNLRLLFQSYGDYALWENDLSGCHWHDLVAIRVQETVSSFKHEAETLSAEDRKLRCREAVRQVMKEAPGDAAEQFRLYKARTGRSRADFFRHKREIESREFDPEADDEAA
jgi:hypothetical protein